jgi:hypothetical protein
MFIASNLYKYIAKRYYTLILLITILNKLADRF